MTTGAWVLLLVLPGALAVGMTLRALEGRVRKRAKPVDSEETVTDQLPEQLRKRVTEDPDDNRICLLQLSTTFCAPCRATRVQLSDYARRTEGVRHLDIDLANHPDWSNPLGVHTTPTTLALDSSGRELFRISGVPRREALDAAIREHLT